MTIFLPDLYSYHFLDTRFFIFLKKITKNPDDNFFSQELLFLKVKRNSKLRM